MITDIVRWGLRSVTTVALTAAVGGALTHLPEPSRELVLVDPAAIPVQTYAAPSSVVLPAFKADDYEVVMPVPTPTPTLSQAPAAPGKSSPVDPKSYARSQVSAGQWTCLLLLWNRESGWNVHASNPSGAYGIPQALPGSKMASAGPDWQNNPVTQINWGLGYIKSVYGTPCAAWAHSESFGWY